MFFHGLFRVQFDPITSPATGDLFFTVHYKTRGKILGHGVGKYDFMSFSKCHISYISVGEFDTKLENIWGLNVTPTDN
jgi:hypothetical protein